MVKRFFSILVYVASILIACTALADTGYEAKTYDLGGPLDRVKLRAEPASDGKILGQYFEGVVFTVLENKGTWSHVRVGNQDGYMMSKFLTTEISDFERITNGISGMVRYPEEDGTLPLYRQPDHTSEILAHMPEGYVRVLGTIGPDWLHVLYTNEQKQDVLGYASSADITNTDNFATLVVDTGDASRKLNLRVKPAKDAKVIGQYFCGATVYRMFDNHTNGDGWGRVRIGDAVGYMITESLDSSSAGVHSYKPPLSETRKAQVALYRTFDGTEAYGVLSRDVAFSVLGERGDRYYIRMETPEPYVYQYAYVDQTDVKAVSASPRASGTLKNDQLLYSMDQNGSYISTDVTASKGAYVGIYASCSREGKRPGGEYIDPSMEWMQCEVEIEPHHFFSGCYVPIDSVDYDTLLEYPAAHRARRTE